MPCVAQKRASAPLAKFVPLSVMMLCGTPYRVVMSVMNVTAVGPFSFLIGLASIHFVNLSTATSRCVMPPRAVLKGPLKDIHQGECGHHAASRSLVAKAFRHGFFWPTALEDALM